MPHFERERSKDCEEERVLLMIEGGCSGHLKRNESLRGRSVGLVLLKGEAEIFSHEVPSHNWGLVAAASVLLSHAASGGAVPAAKF